MAIDYSVLKTECLNNFGVQFAAGNDDTISTALNVVQGEILVNRTFIPTSEVLAALVASEFLLLAPAAISLIQMIITCSAGSIDASQPNIQGAFTTIFGAGTTTRTNLQALLKRTGSRAEQLFGIGTIITPADIAIARTK